MPNSAASTALRASAVRIEPLRLLLERLVSGSTAPITARAAIRASGITNPWACRRWDGRSGGGRRAGGRPSVRSVGPVEVGAGHSRSHRLHHVAGNQDGGVAGSRIEDAGPEDSVEIGITFPGIAPGDLGLAEGEPDEGAGAGAAAAEGELLVAVLAVGGGGAGIAVDPEVAPVLVRSVAGGVLLLPSEMVNEALPEMTKSPETYQLTGRASARVTTDLLPPRVTSPSRQPISALATPFTVRKRHSDSRGLPGPVAAVV